MDEKRNTMRVHVVEGVYLALTSDPLRSNVPTAVDLWIDTSPKPGAPVQTTRFRFGIEDFQSFEQLVATLSSQIPKPGGPKH